MELRVVLGGHQDWGLPTAAGDGAAGSLPATGCRASGTGEAPWSMTVQFQIRGMRDEPELRRQVETDLGELCGLIEVTAAHIALHFQGEVTPAYQAVAMLAVSGPAIHAAARDHTWPAAWQKVVARLREQMEERLRRKKARRQGEARAQGPPSNRGKN